MNPAPVLLAWLSAATPQTPGSSPADSLPRISLKEALSRAAQLDPGYVAAWRQVTDAEWSRRAALAVFILPSINAQTSGTKYSTQQFNIGTGAPATEIVSAQIDARYDLFRGGAKVFDLGRARADLEGARASELEARFRTALFTEFDFYDVLAQRELARVSSERVRRATEQLVVARARVVSGAAVQTDSLQVLLELTRARVELLRQEARLKIARIQLGRRVGEPGPVDAVPLDTVPASPLPTTETAVASEALERSPRALAARAGERSAEAQFRVTRGLFMPRVTLVGNLSAFDDRFFPSGTTRSSIGVTLSLPIWNDGQRELALSRAATNRAILRARRSDAELAVRRDAIEAYEAYNTARASGDLAAVAVVVARENLRVQQERYRAGATTIIDLITAQVSVSEAEAGAVQARYATRLALAGLEALLGRRLFPE